MSINWPGSLPLTPLIQGYDEQTPDVVLRTNMDAGPAKVRRRFTAGTRDITFPMILGLSQIQDFDDFFFITTCGGALQFIMVNPRTGLTENWRFKGPPKYNALTGDRFSTSPVFEIMP